MDSPERRSAGITARVDRIKQLTGEHRSATPPVPKSVKIELTARCDFECYFCASHTRPRVKSDMPWEFYTRIVKEMRKLGVEQLGVFYLGESFLCDWLPEAIRYAKQNCGYPYVFLTTNGRLATADHGPREPQRGAQQAPALLVAIYRGPYHRQRTPVGVLL